MSSSPAKPGRFYLVVSIIVFAFGAFLAGVGIYVGFVGTGWGDGFIYLSFGMTALIAASSFATVRGQLIAQKETDDRIQKLLDANASSTAPRTLKFPERLRVLFRGTVGGQP